ncbi:MAG: PASTA domain-containing protein, partial [Firmicutes bacterium]|nr:PASTA domain-containing protein [Bacillota bacterium]
AHRRTPRAPQGRHHHRQGWRPGPAGDAGCLRRRQTPQPGAMVPLQTGILVYLEEDEQALASPGVKVPDLRGLTIREAGKILNWLNLDLNPLGSGIAVEQNPEPGTIVNNGDTVEVIFSPPLE